MKHTNALLLSFFAAALFISPVHAFCESDCGEETRCCESGSESNFEQALDEKDWDALYDYINTKRTINVQEKSCNLTISGDIRAQWRNRLEGNRKKIFRIIDKDGRKRYFGNNKYNIEFSLKFDYVCEDVWAVGQIQFDGSGGVFNDHSCWTDPEGMHGSGTNGCPEIKKAYIGYNAYCNKETRFDIEIGRRRLYQVFESEVQFLSNFDGILLKYSSCDDCLGDWYVRAAGFVVDARSDHYAYLLETGVYDICETGFDLKYSFVDWSKCGKNLCKKKDPLGSRYQVSQATVAYCFDAPCLDVPAKLFAAGLCNHADARLDRIDMDQKCKDRWQKERFAWYAGITLGEVVKQGDWAFTGQYQWVQARSIPDDDVSGIGNGNCWNNFFTNTNFKGVRLQALYALKDNLTLDLRAEGSDPISKCFDGEHPYRQVRCAVIYAF